jgi:hypothetical protein
MSSDLRTYQAATSSAFGDAIARRGQSDGVKLLEEFPFHAFKTTNDAIELLV